MWPTSKIAASAAGDDDDNDARGEGDAVSELVSETFSFPDLTAGTLMRERGLLGKLGVEDLPPDLSLDEEATFVEWSLRGLNTEVNLDLCAESALLLLQQAGTKGEVEAPVAERAAAENCQTALESTSPVLRKVDVESSL